MEKTYDVCHKKTDLKVFVGVIPEEGLAGRGPAIPFLVMTMTIKYYSTAFIDDILKSMSYPMKNWWGPTPPILLWV